MSHVTIDEIKRRTENNAAKRSLILHPDPEILQDLLEGLSINEARYGYPSCPCRLATGDFTLDRDIICPCDYRDPDVDEYGACYCNLFLKPDMVKSIQEGLRVLERRPLVKQQRTKSSRNNNQLTAKTTDQTKFPESPMNLWYCKQCGYVAFREDAPYICPICNAKKDMFEKILLQSHFLAS
jgi:ferredoxin-thioredoxin reductase catalytic subunit